MKNPTSVEIGPYDVKITTLDASDAEKNYGQFHPDGMKIGLHPQFTSPQQHGETLLHEILHAIWYVARCNPKDGEERLVSTLATQLCAVIKSNPELIAWIQAMLKKHSTS